MKEENETATDPFGILLIKTLKRNPASANYDMLFSIFITKPLITVIENLI